MPCMVDVVDEGMCGRQPSQLISQIIGMEVEGHRARMPGGEASAFQLSRDRQDAPGLQAYFSDGECT